MTNLAGPRRCGKDYLNIMIDVSLCSTQVSPHTRDGVDDSMAGNLDGPPTPRAPHSRLFGGDRAGFRDRSWCVHAHALSLTS